MVLEDKWSWKRFGLALVILAEAAAMTAGILWIHGSHEGDVAFALLNGAAFGILMILGLESNRLNMGPLNEKANNFARAAAAYGISCLLTAAMSFLPDYARPVLLVSVTMTMATTPFLGLLAGCYSSVLLVCTMNQSIALLSCYLLLCVCGCVVALYLQKRADCLWSSIMFLGVTVCFSISFSMLEGGALHGTVVLYSILCGAISASAGTLLFYLWGDKIDSSRERKLTQIIDESYGLVHEMRLFSIADYEHAKKVSRIAGECAQKLQLDKHLAEAAGFYYRVGRLEGEPYVENGVMVAKKHGFPPELIQILGEYNGEKQLPSTTESALVHIVDHVVAKFDVLDPATLSSSWNQDIVVYQTLNENSAQGLYDKSGLSMNMFLLVRDYLIKEAGLYDNSIRK